MLSSGLPISRYVNVQVSLTTPGIVSPAINSLMIIGSSDIIPPGERARQYANISEVGAEFADDTPEFLAAEIYFSQNPRPDNVFIGRWVKTPTSAYLTGGILNASEQSMAAWQAITDGGFSITVGSPGTPKAVTGLDFSAESNLNGVASAINTAMTTATVAASVVWDGEKFVFKTTATGATAQISFLAPPGSGTDISALLKGTQATGARTSPGFVPETPVSALVAIDGLYSTQFYGVVFPEATETDQLDLAAYVEAGNPPHYFGVTTNDTAVLDPLSTTDIASQMSNFGYNKTAVQYSSNSPYAICSYLGRILTTDWLGVNTMITLMYKQEPGVQIEFLSTDQANTLRTKNCNVYAGVANGAQMIQYGQSASGEYTDTIIGADALALDIQNGLFNAMYTSPTKIPQTDSGMTALRNAVSAVCSRYAENGYLGPGIWNAPGFGTLKSGDTLAVGFYVYAPSIAVQSDADRAARRAPLIQVAARCASAIHEANVTVFVMA